jgi:hypothetical protein
LETNVHTGAQLPTVVRIVQGCNALGHAKEQTVQIIARDSNAVNFALVLTAHTGAQAMSAGIIVSEQTAPTVVRYPTRSLKLQSTHLNSLRSNTLARPFSLHLHMLITREFV